MSSVSAASGPYAAELSASRPKIGMPAIGPMCSARSSLVASGRPKSRVRTLLDRAMQIFIAAVEWEKGRPPRELSHVREQGSGIRAEGPASRVQGRGSREQARENHGGEPAKA